MLKMKTMLCLICLFFAGLTTIANADVIYNQSLSETDNYGFMSNINGDLSADNFTVSGFSSIQSITWYGMYESAGASTVDSFDIKIFDLSGTELFSDLSITSANKSYSGFDDAFGETIYKYEVSIADWELSTGEYLLSISNENSDFSNWYWADGLGGDGISYYWDSASWIADDIGIDMAFTLTGMQNQNPMPVPEPGSILLLGVGLLGLFSTATRRRSMSGKC